VAQNEETSDKTVIRELLLAAYLQGGESTALALGSQVLQQARISLDLQIQVLSARDLTFSQRQMHRGLATHWERAIIEVYGTLAALSADQLRQQLSKLPTEEKRSTWGVSIRTNAAAYITNTSKVMVSILAALGEPKSSCATHSPTQRSIGSLPNNRDPQNYTQLFFDGLPPEE